MKIRLTLLRLLVFTVLAGTTATAAQLVWDRTEVELEMEPDQKDIRAAFRVTNKGEDTVRINRIKSSCGCTGSIIDRKILEPGEATEVIGTFHRGRREGLNRNRLEVFIDDEKTPVATLQMTVKIPRLIEATPQIVYWSPTQAKTPRQVRVKLHENYLSRIDDIEYNRKMLELTVEDDPQDQSAKVLKILPRSFETVQRETITVRASGPQGRKAETRIHSLVRPE
ncbi:MAG: DUF1573 domain-containing protein [Opitutales bacterium]